MKIKRNEEFAEGAEVYARVIYRQPLKLVTLGKRFLVPLLLGTILMNFGIV